jgi:hypothetical protein
VSKVIENNDFRDLYFHPDDGIWNVIIKHTDDTCNNGPGRSIDLSHTTGNGSFKKLKTYSSLTDNFETSTKYFLNCSGATPTILNLGNLTINFRSLTIKHDSKLLSKIHRLPQFDVREIVAKRETEIVRVVGPLTNIPFYLNYDGSQKPDYSNPETFRTVIELVNGINGTP